MLTPEFLRRQAENCLRIARSCFDLASAERLRLMAAELNAKAAEMRRQDERRGHRAGPRGPLEREHILLEAHPVIRRGLAAIRAPEFR